MTEIKFDNDLPSSTTPHEHRKPKGFAGWMIGKGLAKDEKQANQILIFLVLALIMISCFLIFGSGPSSAGVEEVVDAI